MTNAQTARNWVAQALGDDAGGGEGGGVWGDLGGGVSQGKRGRYVVM